MDEVARMASGYVYYVSLKGVTGAANIDLSEVSRRLPKIRAHIDLPIGVGFGIRDAETARSIASVSDAVVIGSRLVQEIEESAPAEVEQRVTQWLGDIRRAMDRA